MRGREGDHGGAVSRHLASQLCMRFLLTRVNHLCSRLLYVAMTRAQALLVSPLSLLPYKYILCELLTATPVAHRTVYDARPWADGQWAVPGEEGERRSASQIFYCNLLTPLSSARSHPSCLKKGQSRSVQAP